MRFVWAAALLLVAVVAGLLAWGALQNLWSDYKDSETSTYLVVGVPALLVALAALYGAVRVARSRPR
jgi:succinate dehydrogenase hydrophobic anchor subunit